MKNEKQDHMALVAIVGIVAIVGLFLMFTGNGNNSAITDESKGDLSGQAVAVAPDGYDSNEIIIVDKEGSGDTRIQIYDSEEDALNAISNANLIKSENIESVEEFMQEYTGINPGKIIFECDGTGCSITIPGVGAWGWGW